MNIYRFTLLSILAWGFVNSASAVTLSSGGNINAGTVLPPTEITNIGGSALTYDYNIFVDGDLFLDYSVLSENNIDLIIGPNVALNATSIIIYAYSDIAIAPNLASVSIFSNPLLTMNQTTDTLLYSDLPIASGLFEATGNIYVGNYLSFKPVPLPATLWLFISGLLILFSRFKSKINYKFLFSSQSLC